jgi:enoyl-CoA hydratase/carnithine racemase
MVSSSIPNIFCAGLDLDILINKPILEVRKFLELLYIELWDTQYNMTKPTIAVIDGAARGGGMTLAISCDIIIASDKASFGYPEIDLGLLPAIHFNHLPKIVGRYRAFDLLFSGRKFDADEAFSMGLINKKVSKTNLLDEARKMASVFAQKSPTAIRLGRAAFMRTNDFDYRRGVANAVEDFCNVAMTPDAQEGLKAFLEKRKPYWK